MNSSRVIAVEKEVSLKTIKLIPRKRKIVDIAPEITKSRNCYEMPEYGMSKDLAYSIIKKKISKDKTLADSLAKFGTPFIEKPVLDLVSQNLHKNFSDAASYPETADIDTRCINIIARLFNLPVSSKEENVVGCSTVGSSEANILGALAMKRRWQLNRISKGLSTDKPNFVMSASCHCAWFKATKFFDIECRVVEISENSFSIDPQKAVDLVDENTIGLCAVLGITYTGHYDNVKAMNDLLDEKCKLNDWDIGIHVDAASGGLIAPFVTPELEWDFRLPRVHSINVSGHKYGMCFSSNGWCIWRNSTYLPKDLVFNDDLSAYKQESMNLNFSKPSVHQIAQYYALLRRASEGFKEVIGRFHNLTEYLSGKLENMGCFEVINNRTKECIPLVAFHLKEKKSYNEFDIAAKLKNYGWIVPAYFLPASLKHVSIMRVVVHEEFTMTQADKFVRDITHLINQLDEDHKKAFVI